MNGKIVELDLEVKVDGKYFSYPCQAEDVISFHLSPDGTKAYIMIFAESIPDENRATPDLFKKEFEVRGGKIQYMETKTVNGKSCVDVELKHSLKYDDYINFCKMVARTWRNVDFLPDKYGGNKLFRVWL